ncbi:acyl-CoA desaturase (plasmid) [Ralstonia syzygii]|uniref:Acyl-CoA desaturase n=1 Tax=Ralstonia syzygii TaxID=28097 RepID=A0ABX7ZMZ4_9RALS|nr:acyl-CoA desaturase [Ralstonia syzygii]QUP56357.1 acyl-CoA desaturase [Ralstonia syzygii]
MSLPGTGIQQAERVGIVRFRVWLVHIASLGMFFLPVTPQLLGFAVIGYFVRVFAWEAGSHRYFSHRAFRTTRVFQLFLAVLAAASAQRGPLWWAAHHRVHHRHSDQPGDPHSPVQRGFWYAHLGWVLDQDKLNTDLDAVKDLSRFPELVWVNQYHYLFPYALLVLTWAAGQYTAAFGRGGLGLSAMVWGFFLPTLLSLHATFAVNTLVHARKVGWLQRRRFHTSDTTTNAWLLAIPTMGAGWHNNHHRYMGAARAGFYWWELDLAFCVLKVLALFGIVWDLHPVPDKVLAEGRQRKAAADTARPLEEMH